MMARRNGWIIFVLLLTVTIGSLYAAVPALAGGWAVIKLDTLPGEVVAGEAVTVGFMVLQHGISPLEGQMPEIRFTHPESGESLVVYAQEEGEVGHYSATFTLPAGGDWRWSIQAFNMDQPMPDFHAVEPANPTAMQESSAVTIVNQAPSSQFSPPMIIGIVGTMIAILGLVYALRRRSTWAMPVVAIGLLLGVAGFVRAGIARANTGEAVQTVAASNQKVEAQGSMESQAVGQIQYGKDLFVAKGCLGCHRNDRVEARYAVFSTEEGPNLTSYKTTHKTSEEYLRVWLKDPQEIKPDTRMPNLELSEVEIEALSAFLLEETGAAGSN
jgi:hypothetical protein